MFGHKVRIVSDRIWSLDSWHKWPQGIYPYGGSLSWGAQWSEWTVEPSCKDSPEALCLTGRKLQGRQHLPAGLKVSQDLPTRSMKMTTSIIGFPFLDCNPALTKRQENGWINGGLKYRSHTQTLKILMPFCQYYRSKLLNLVIKLIPGGSNK